MAPKPKGKPGSATKTRSSAAPKSKPKSPQGTNGTAAKSKKKVDVSPSPPGSPSPLPSLGLDKALVLRIIVAKLEASKTCDWYELSQKLAKDGTEGGGGGKANGGGGGGGKRKGGKKGKKDADDEGYEDKPTAVAKKAQSLSGSDLHDLYHNKILPGLKAGRALWMDEMDLDDIDGRPSTKLGVTASGIIGEEVDMFDDDPSEFEGIAVAKKPSSASNKASSTSTKSTSTKNRKPNDASIQPKSTIRKIVEEDEYERDEDGTRVRSLTAKLRSSNDTEEGLDDEDDSDGNEYVASDADTAMSVDSDEF